MRPDTDAAFRERLEAIVWGDSQHPYSRTLDAVSNLWWNRSPAAVRDWALQQSEEYGKRCADISKKCNLADPGVMVIYDHYDNIKSRYWNVHSALVFIHLHALYS